MEETSAVNLRIAFSRRQPSVIYLSGIVNEEILSKHLTSRKNVERILDPGLFINNTPAGIIIIGFR
ncbi:MAG: hypothetical protein IPH69_01840 [Bacteroidales bacterium]|nr:hypothetical protein [Bacteroidales bacterium]